MIPDLPFPVSGLENIPREVWTEILTRLKNTGYLKYLVREVDFVDRDLARVVTSQLSLHEVVELATTFMTPYVYIEPYSVADQLEITIVTPESRRVRYMFTKPECLETILTDMKFTGTREIKLVLDGISYFDLIRLTIHSNADNIIVDSEGNALVLFVKLLQGGGQS